MNKTVQVLKYEFIKMVKMAQDRSQDLRKHL